MFEGMKMEIRTGKSKKDKRKTKKGQTTAYKTLHKNIKIE